MSILANWNNVNSDELVACERYVKGVNAMADSRLVYSAKLTAYMEDKIDQE
jgi:hypothetical protein